METVFRLKASVGFMKTYFLFLIICFVFIRSGFAQNENISWTANLEAKEAFIENHGQFDGRNWQKDSKIEFGVDYNKAFIFFTEKGLTYRFDKIIRNPNRKKEEHDSPKRTNISELIHVTWVGANQNTEIITEDLAENYFSYAIKDLATKEVVNVNYIKGYKKLTYKNLYDNIDVEYIFHPESGIKYSIILHPGADASKVKMKYSSGHTSVSEEQIEYALDENGELQIKTSLAEVTERKPYTFYKNSKQEINSSFNFDNDILSFNLGSYDNTKEIIIDPWIVSPAFTTSTAVWEVETDSAGNVYVIGGETPMELKKYNSTGTLQWTYTTPWDTASVWLGTLATDDAGVSYITSGTSPEIERITTAGGMVWHQNGSGFSDEYWSITFNCDKTKLIVGGTILNMFAFEAFATIFDMDITNGNVLSSQNLAYTDLMGFGATPVEVRSISSSKGAKYVFLTHEEVGAINQNIGACPNDDPIFQVDNGHNLAYKCENYLPATQNGGGLKALVANDLYFYTHSGDQIHKRLLSDGSLVTSIGLTGGNSTIDPFFGGTVVENSGLDVDDCGNVYAGSGDRVVKFDQDLNFISEVTLSFTVYDVSVNSNGEVVVVGAQSDNQMAANRNGRIQSVNLSACAQFALVCCDANICPEDTFCTDDPPVTLIPSTPGGIWSGTGITDSTAGTFDPSVAGGGIHTIVYTMGCGSDSIKITVNICDSIFVCQELNGDVTVSGGTSPYSWDTYISATTTPITNQTECVNCGYTWIIFQCFDGGFPVSDCTVPGYWTNFATGTTVTPPGTDTIRVTDTYGNFLVITDVSSLPNCTGCSMTVSTNSTDEICGQGDGTAIATPSGGASPYTYQWDDPASQTTATADSLTAGTYDVTVTDSAGCTETVSVTVNSSGGLTLTTSTTDASCAGGSDGTTTVTPSGGTPPYTYQWDANAGSQTTSTATGLSAGTYSITVTDSSGCNAIDSVTIIEPSAMILTPGSVDATCGNFDGQTSVTVTGGTATYTYVWNDTGAQTTATATGLSSGAYIVTVTDANGCQDSTTALVNDAGAATLQITDSSMVTSCGENDGSATVTPSGGIAPYTYLWDNGETDSIADTLTVGIHIVIVTDAAGCISSIQVFIDGPAGITATVTGTDITCYGDSNGTVVVSVFGGTAPFTYLWNPQVGGLTDTVATGLPAGTYSIMITDAVGCVVTESTVVTINASPSAYAGADVTIVNGESTILSGSGGISYLWTSDPPGFTSIEQNPTVLPVETTTYILSVEDINGCSDVDSVLVTVTEMADVLIPDIFSPNGDGENDMFYVYGKGIRDILFIVYDRWGEKVYEAKEVINGLNGKIISGWDGTFRGKPLNPAVFVYYLEANDGEIIRQGNITLVR